MPNNSKRVQRRHKVVASDVVVVLDSSSWHTKVTSPSTINAINHPQNIVRNHEPIVGHIVGLFSVLPWAFGNSFRRRRLNDLTTQAIVIGLDCEIVVGIHRRRQIHDVSEFAFRIHDSYISPFGVPKFPNVGLVILQKRKVGAGGSDRVIGFLALSVDAKDRDFGSRIVPVEIFLQLGQEAKLASAVTSR